MQPAYANTNRPATAATKTMLTELLLAAPVKGVVLPVGLAMAAELEAPATPGTPAAAPPVAAACAGAGVPATRPTLEDAPV